MEKNEQQPIWGSLKTDHKQYQIEDSIWLLLSIENVSKENVYLFVPERGPEIFVKKGSSYEIKAPDDTTIEFTGEKELAPGENFTQKYLLTKRIVIKKAGDYSIECKVAIEYSSKSIRQKDPSRETHEFAVSSIVDIQIENTVNQGAGDKKRSGGYEMIGWTSEQVLTGFLVDSKPQLIEIPVSIDVEDIRNCSVAKEKPWIAFAGINKLNKNNELWWLDRETGKTRLLISTKEIINYVALSPSGDQVCYTAFPVGTDGALSLYLFDIKNEKADLVLKGQVSRDCIPCWRTDNKILYHTADNKIMEIDSGSKKIDFLFPGSFPFATNDGTKIIFREQDDLFIWDSKNGEREKLPIKKNLDKKNLGPGMSWSPDGKLISISHTSGTFGYQSAFATIEVESGVYNGIDEKYLKGLSFL